MYWVLCVCFLWITSGFSAVIPIPALQGCLTIPRNTNLLKTAGIVPGQKNNVSLFEQPISCALEKQRLENKAAAPPQLRFSYLSNLGIQERCFFASTQRFPSILETKPLEEECILGKSTLALFFDRAGDIRLDTNWRCALPGLADQWESLDGTAGLLTTKPEKRMFPINVCAVAAADQCRSHFALGPKGECFVPVIEGRTEAGTKLVERRLKVFLTTQSEGNSLCAGPFPRSFTGFQIFQLPSSSSPSSSFSCKKSPRFLVEPDSIQIPIRRFQACRSFAEIPLSNRTALQEGTIATFVEGRDSLTRILDRCGQEAVARGAQQYALSPLAQKSTEAKEAVCQVIPLISGGSANQTRRTLFVPPCQSPGCEDTNTFCRLRALDEGRLFRSSKTWVFRVQNPPSIGYRRMGGLPESGCVLGGRMSKVPLVPLTDPVDSINACARFAAQNCYPAFLIGPQGECRSGSIFHDFQENKKGKDCVDNRIGNSQTSSDFLYLMQYTTPCLS